MKQLLLLIPLLFLGCKKEKPAPLPNHSVGFADLRDQITQTGEVKPLLKVDIKSEASGKIEKIYIKEGQRVAKGDTLLAIDPYRLTIQRQKLQLRLKRTAVELRSATRELNRAAKLNTTGIVSSSEIDALEDRVALAKIAKREAQLELNDIDEQLSKTMVLSPLDGVVTDLPVEEGEIAVSATSGFQAGTALATVANIDQLEIISRIGEADYTQLSAGQGVTIRPEAVATSTTGSISFIALSAKRESGQELSTFEVRIAIDSLIGGIAPGINVNVDFILFEKSGVLAVPAHFVQRGKGGTAVFLKDESPQGYRRQTVTLGATDYRHYEVIDGLSEGDSIVLPPEEKGGKKRWWVCTECHNPHDVEHGDRKSGFAQLNPEPAPMLPKGMSNADHERVHHGPASSGDTH